MESIDSLQFVLNLINKRYNTAAEIDDGMPEEGWFTVCGALNRLAPWFETRRPSFVGAEQITVLLLENNQVRFLLESYDGDELAAETIQL